MDWFSPNESIGHNSFSSVFLYIFRSDLTFSSKFETKNEKNEWTIISKAVKLIAFRKKNPFGAIRSRYQISFGCYNDNNNGKARID